ncbi:gliding motility protein GldN [Rapidithrix thailandica]|uniref:Gliding motility protein GldN n=1 Tax=Rapidithrix thailandica TaxID=413964 RepID=A0AAW9RUH4_9BACT
MKSIIRFTSFVVIMLGTVTSYAQLSNPKPTDNQYNAQSVRPVRSHDIMWKKSLWFRIDLRSKINSGFYAQNREITKVIIDAVKSGKLQPFKNDSLSTRMSQEEFIQGLRIPQTEREEIMFEDNWESTQEENANWGTNTNETVELGPEEYLARQLYVIELKEDLIFDKRRSRMIHDPLAITILIPSEVNPTGIDKVLASFSYKELVENVFRNDPNAVWFNSQNAAAHMSLEHAFDLRLYDGLLVKYENPRDNRIVDIYGEGKRGLIKSQEALYKLMEYEATLWSY